MKYSGRGIKDTQLFENTKTFGPHCKSDIFTTSGLTLVCSMRIWSVEYESTTWLELLEHAAKKLRVALFLNALNELCLVSYSTPHPLQNDYLSMGSEKSHKRGIVHTHKAYID